MDLVLFDALKELWEWYASASLAGASPVPPRWLMRKVNDAIDAAERRARNWERVNMAELGKWYRDRITGFEGCAVAITEFLYGCRRIALVGMVGDEPKDFSFDEPQLEELPKRHEVVTTEEERSTGGERPSPARRAMAHNRNAGHGPMGGSGGWPER